MIALPPTNKKPPGRVTPTTVKGVDMPPTTDIVELVTRELMRDKGLSREEARRMVEAFT